MSGAGAVPRVASGPLAGWPRLGFGVSGALAGPLVSAAAVKGLAKTAESGGAGYFDTAPAYGAGEGERRLGAALKALPRKAVRLSTKGGIASSGPGRRRRDFDPESLERGLEASLARLGVDQVDLFLTHGAAPVELTEPLFRRLAAFRSSGRARLIGVAGRGLEIDRAVASGVFDVAMTPVQPGLGPDARARLQRLRAAGIGLIGVEIMRGARPPAGDVLSPGRLYRLARDVVRAAPPPSGRLSRPEALSWFYEADLADIALVSTTRPERLVQNIAVAASARRAA